MNFCSLRVCVKNAFLAVIVFLQQISKFISTISFLFNGKEAWHSDKTIRNRPEIQTKKVSDFWDLCGLNHCMSIFLQNVPWKNRQNKRQVLMQDSILRLVFSPSAHLCNFGQITFPSAQTPDLWSAEIVYIILNIHFRIDFFLYSHIRDTFLN